MQLFKKKDKRYNNHLDNYSNKYSNTMLLGLAYVVVALVGYFIYWLYNYLFS